MSKLRAVHKLGLACAGILAASTGVTVAATPAMADTVSSGNCTVAFADAVAADTLVNGPVHDEFGTIVVGDFTPGVFVAGATGATSNYVSCLV